jgi:hypothetical protein
VAEKYLQIWKDCSEEVKTAHHMSSTYEQTQKICVLHVKIATAKLKEKENEFLTEE